MSWCPALFGKLPSHGDFLRRGISPKLADRLDVWSTAGITALRARDPDGWKQRFTRAPAVRFLIPARAWDCSTIMGLVRPSADGVGRIFPVFALAVGSEEAEHYIQTAATMASLDDLDAMLKAPFAGLDQLLRALSEWSSRIPPLDSDGGDLILSPASEDRWLAASAAPPVISVQHSFWLRTAPDSVDQVMIRRGIPDANDVWGVSELRSAPVTK